MLAWIDILFMGDVALINGIGKQVIEHAAPENAATALGTIGSKFNLGLISLGIEIIDKLYN